METRPAQNMQSLSLTGQANQSQDPRIRTQRLEKACQDFEALFLSHMLKTMRASSGEAEGALFGKGFGGEMFQEMFDAEVAQSMAAQRSIGLARQLLEQLKASGVIPSEGGEPLSAQARLAALEPEIVTAAQETGLDPALIRAVIERESGGRTQIVSAKGAKGLMQLMDSTAQEMGVTHPFDAAQNIQGGARYLRQMLDRFHGDLDLALAAYNAGPGTVEQYGGVPPFAETEEYIIRVKASFNAYKKLASGAGSDAV